MAHFSANCPATLLAAAQLVQPLCDAIDINLGCPQRVAHAGHFGSFLLDDADRALVLDMVRTLRAGLAVPVFVKIRLLETVDKTVELCAQLHQAGAALIAIHARHRVSLVARTGPGARDGPALLDYVAAVKRALPGAVIIANGNVRCFEDVESNLASTGADGVMSAEGLLDDPTLFAAGAAGARTEEQRLEVALEYLDLVDRWPAAVKTVVFHVRRMCCAALARLQLLEDCLCAASVPDVRRVVLLALGYLRDGGFVHDPDKEQRGREAAARELGRRKEYEARMRRKARREGRAEDFYLQRGVEPPSAEELARLRALAADAAFAEWKQLDPQHCYAFHLLPGGCPRDRACAFLHADPSQAESLSYG